MKRERERERVNHGGSELKIGREGKEVVALVNFCHIVGFLV